MNTSVVVLYLYIHIYCILHVYSTFPGVLFFSCILEGNKRRKGLQLKEIKESTVEAYIVERRFPGFLNKKYQVSTFL